MKLIKNYLENKFLKNNNKNIANIINVLRSYIDLKQCENNKKIYFSYECPFCDEKGKRVFRFNTKLKVGKSYCCGRSFKELYWLKKQLNNKDYAEEYAMIHRHGMYNFMSEKQYKERLKYYFENKKRMKLRSFEKFLMDDSDLPF